MNRTVVLGKFWEQPKAEWRESPDCDALNPIVDHSVLLGWWDTVVAMRQESELCKASILKVMWEPKPWHPLLLPGYYTRWEFFIFFVFFQYMNKIPIWFWVCHFPSDWEYNPVEQLDVFLLVLLWELHTGTWEHFGTSWVNNGNNIAPYLQMSEI